MITISEIAKQHFIKLLNKQNEGTQIRVFVMNPGRINAECGISYCSPENIDENDLKLDFDEFFVYVDNESAPFLTEAEIDFVTDELGSQLTLKAPNAKLKKIDENAPLIDKVDYFLQTEINPQLSSHGGMVSLIEITEDNIVILQFGGGCNGCSMVDFTLKEGIEKELLEKFPEIKSVKDTTEHIAGEHSFY